MSIEILSPGLYTTVQDRGRPGTYAMGLPPSGALDLCSHDLANALVGNAATAATLEITFVGPVLRWGHAAIVAVTGADIDVTLDGDAVPLWSAVHVEAGQELRFGLMRSGARAYLAVRGGIDVPLVMGSRSTYVLSGIGGHAGRPLKAGDVLPVGIEVAAEAAIGARVPEELWPAPSAGELRVTRGLCDYRLTAEADEALHSGVFTVSPEANRTGYRLTGPSLTFADREAPLGAGADPSNVVNLGYPLGSIQAPSGSELICLHRDAVTGGGYATIGTVISADLDVLAQAKYPDQVVFVPVTLDEALAARRQRALRIGRAVATLREHP